MALTKLDRRNRIRKRIRKTVKGNAQRPRVAVYRSNKEIYAQLIDDESGKTIFTVSSLKSEGSEKLTKVELSTIVGKKVADKAKEMGLESLVFDRSGYLYHGRVKALAEGIRENGIKI